MKTKVEKDCMNQTLKILKIILMSAFIANLPSPELGLSLSRRMSSSQENSKAENLEDKNKEEKKEVITEKKHKAV